ncbi:MAG: CoA-binding protein [Lentisphaerae bacterium RIFOXYA12_FULL_48_11]|nr:MAG: CoA-binding protein [Lentisphaerae bacterium RIFOXYA12_FULL_48_11]
MNVAVIGASNKPERYSYKAIALLREKGHKPYPVHPSLPMVEDLTVYPALKNIPTPVDTISIYLSAANQTAIIDDILESGARRVIFNPGAENPELSERLKKAGIEAINACTLVLLKTGQF